MNESLAKVSRTSGGGGGARARGSFTLIELLVVMGVIAVLAVLTLMSMRAIASDARLASATNAVKAALDNARAMAMKNNTIVLIVFRPRFEGHNKQVVEIVTAKWSGDSKTIDYDGDGVIDDLSDRFVPIPEVPIRQLPGGVKVAGPYYREPDGPPFDGLLYGEPTDELWVTQTHLPAMRGDEAGGELVGVMYMPDGTTQTRNPQNDSTAPWVDFDNSGTQETAIPNEFWEYTDPNDETNINLVPFLAVFEDTAARELFDTQLWEDPEVRTLDLSGYITQFADRIHFNRYTGVVMK